MNFATASYIKESFTCFANPSYSLPENSGAFQIHGDCMEGSGIYDRDYIIVDFNRKPRIGDPCLCEISGKLMVKKLLQVLPRGLFGVGTDYNRKILFSPGKDGNLVMNRGFWTDTIHAVVIGCADSERHIRWLNDFRDYPEEFPAPVAMHGDVKDVRIR